MTRIRVNQQRLAAGEPPVAVSEPDGKWYAAGVEIGGPCRLVWDPSCDPPSVFIETDSPCNPIAIKPPSP